jgi:hypothetical protein
MKKASSDGYSFHRIERNVSFRRVHPLQTPLKSITLARR